MKILERPDEELILILPATSVATGIGAGNRAQNFRRRIRAVRHAGRKNNPGGERHGLVTNCFTHGCKLVNGVAP
jgi:hypothetical protein